MADTWPVNNGAVGSRGSADRVDTSNPTPIQAPQRRFGSFNPDGTVQGPGQAARPGARPPPAPASGTTEETTEPTAPPAVTIAGLTPGQDVITARTAIQDALQSIIQITTDSFLQGLPGGLSQVLGGAIQGLLNQLPSVMSNLLNSTGLTSVLGNVVETISSNIGTALNNVAGALSDAGRSLFTELGNTITSIPGLGPVIQNFSGAVNGLADTLSTAYSNLDPVLQATVDGAIASVGTRLLDRAGLPSINPQTAGLIAGSISFATNPANNFRNIAGTSREMDARIFPITGDNVFGNLAARAEIAASELESILTTQTGNIFSFTNTPVDIVNEVRTVTNQTIEDVIPQGARLFDGTIFSNERITSFNGRSFVIPR